MECRTVAGLLSEYIEAREGKQTALTSSQHETITTHLKGCANCQALQGELQEIYLAARELPLRTPPKALWARIANQIEIEQATQSSTTSPSTVRGSRGLAGWWEQFRRQTFIFSLPQMAGAGALAMVLLMAGVYQLSTRNGSTEIDFTRLQGALLREENSKRAEIERKMEAINERKANWDPEFRADFERQLSKIEESLRQCQARLAESPNDLTQVQKMLDLYEEKRQLLEDVERLNW